MLRIILFSGLGRSRHALRQAASYLRSSVNYYADADLPSRVAFLFHSSVRQLNRLASFLRLPVLSLILVVIFFYWRIIRFPEFEAATSVLVYAVCILLRDTKLNSWRISDIRRHRKGQKPGESTAFYPRFIIHAATFVSRSCASRKQAL